ncbi:hypothetical protein CRENPOLYSF1_140016 [Crenothrix polyspora]|uniref:Uncharacterized protein n=1 Tax=Crenothrix polyspora TaxID=360316 RepID=A0A1R4H204_9GAMM|nr:hypothetical protein CRENPOLYSF1_140016 [Crenothrix polyspora]
MINDRHDFNQPVNYNVTVRTELVEVYRSCFDKLSANGGCNCPKLKKLYIHWNPVNTELSKL